MKTNSISHIAALSVAVGAIAIAALAPISVSAKSPTPDVLIVNSGSNNTLAYTIDVSRSGTATYQTENGSGSASLSNGMVHKLYSDIANGRPLAQLPSSNCLKSAGFGTFTHISFGSERTPDVSCPGNDITAALFRDAKAIAAVLGVSDIPRQPSPTR